MGVAGEEGGIGTLVRRRRIEAQHGADDVLGRALDIGERQRAVVQGGGKRSRALLAKRHLEVETGANAADGIA